MNKTETPDERKQRLLKNLEKARAASKEKRELIKAQKEDGTYQQPIVMTKKPQHLDKIIREILNDDGLVDKVITNQPEYWGKLPVKNGGYIIATVMMVKAMGGDIKAAEWIRKTGFGDKVLLEAENGFFSRSDFLIQVVPSKQLESIDPKEITEGEIKQIEE